MLAALSVAGLPTDRFYFEGFLPPKQGARRARIAELARIDATLVLFEGGSRIADTLHDLAEVLGERDGAVCRELTKLHEDIRRAPLRVLAAEAPDSRNARRVRDRHRAAARPTPAGSAPTRSTIFSKRR